MVSLHRRLSPLMVTLAVTLALIGCAHAALAPTPPANALSETRPWPIASPRVIAEYPTLTPLAGPSKPVLGSDGNVWFTEVNSDIIGRITSAGVVTEFAIPIPGCPTRVALGPDSNVWFTLPCSVGFIGKITPAGSITTFRIPTLHGGPNGLAVGADGRLWFSEQNVDKIGAVTTAGTFTEYSIPTYGASLPPIARPLDITSGPDGNLWFTEHLGNKIGRITTAGQVTQFAIPIANSYPSGITSGPDGNLWFAEQGTNRIGRITPSGQITQFPLPACGVPYQITAASDGNFYITCSGPGLISNGASQIARMTTGGLSAIYPVPSANSDPLGIATGSDGNLWFTEFNASKIGVFRFR